MIILTIDLYLEYSLATKLVLLANHVKLTT